MFTGIVEELGRVALVAPTRAARASRSTRTTVLDDAGDRRLDRGERLLPHGRRARRRLVGGRRRHRDARPHRARRARRRRPGQPRAAAAARRPARRPPGAGHVDGVGRVAGASPLADGSTPVTFSAPPDVLALRRREGLDHGRRHQPHGHRTSTTTRFDVAVDPAHARGHHARAQGRRRRRVNLEVDISPSTSSAARHQSPAKGADDAVHHDRERDRRRSPAASWSIVVDDADRENEGDLIMAAEKVTPEAMAFMIRHTSGVICMPLEGDAPRRAPAAADGGRQHRGAAHRVHGLGRRQARAPRPASPPPTAPRPCTRSSTARPRPDDLARPGPHLPAALPRGRRAQARRPHRGRRRPRPPRRACTRPACWPRS